MHSQMNLIYDRHIRNNITLARISGPAPLKHKIRELRKRVPDL